MGACGGVLAVTSHLKIRDLELVVALCEEGTFTQAAKRVGITEPALCKRLLMIEGTVQARLFERNHNCVTITEAGRHFVEHAKECIHSLHCAVHEAHEAKRGEHHKLRIGASAYLSANLIKLLQTGELRLYHDLAIQGKRILISQQMEQVVVVPSGLESLFTIF
jgi:LysR family cyn operon transcriptional activator